MVIRPEIAEDIPSIRAVTVAAFKGAPYSSGTEAAIVDALRDAGALTLSLVAEDHGRIIGHVAFSPITINGEAGRWFGLGPVSVEPGEQRRGIGQALIRDGLERLRAAGAEGCVLLGDPAYYRRFGFVSDPKLRYGDVPPEYFQRLSFNGAEPEGVAAYHAGFDAGRPD
ncbi:GNAT family N-acetyltransferase [Microvirga sp. CF3016]|uniref:GNAT family N-acetyltransferase n=1 Tax=Microvirga sp. CF3016 TaxID=3110181 RepID=UPI002E78C312|nr:N-acetyltransferase [Microvirga sp. CF3016]MEE1611790.1 N-acetyltransferase [Microvirga sp. CF3016]